MCIRDSIISNIKVLLYNLYFTFGQLNLFLHCTYLPTISQLLRIMLINLLSLTQHHKRFPTVHLCSLYLIDAFQLLYYVSLLFGRPTVLISAYQKNARGYYGITSLRSQGGLQTAVICVGVGTLSLFCLLYTSHFLF